MLKNINGHEIQISKEQFLEDMLDFPELEADHDYDILDTTYTLQIPHRFEELIKRIAAKVFSEKELLEILGDSRQNFLIGKTTYSI